MILDTPGVEHAVSFAGFSGATRANSPNAGAIFVGPKPFEEREKRPNLFDALLGELQGKLSTHHRRRHLRHPAAARAGSRHRRRFQVSRARSRRAWHRCACKRRPTSSSAHATKAPQLSGVFTTFRASTPQLYADVDRVKAHMLNVPLANVFEALQVYLGSVYVNDFNLLRPHVPSAGQAEGAFADSPTTSSTSRRAARMAQMVPLGSVVDISWRSGPRPRGALQHVSRPRKCRAMPRQASAPARRWLTSNASPQRCCRRAWPSRGPISPTKQRLAGNTAIYIFPLCVLFVFLVHSAEYESWPLPLAIILIAPICFPSRWRRLLPRYGQQPDHADRVRRADRSRGEERRADRRVRQATGRAKAATGSAPRSKPAACACGRF